MKTILIQCSAVVVIFVAGVWVGKTTTADAAGKGKVFEIRTYTTNEGKLDALHARFRNHTTRLFEKHGMTNVGYWKPLDEPLSKNTLIYIVSHSDREAAKKAWEEFRKDPEWLKVKQESEVNGVLTAKVDSIYLEATDYSKIK